MNPSVKPTLPRSKP